MWFVVLSHYCHPGQRNEGLVMRIENAHWVSMCRRHNWPQAANPTRSVWGGMDWCEAVSVSEGHLNDDPCWRVMRIAFLQVCLPHNAFMSPPSVRLSTPIGVSAASWGGVDTEAYRRWSKGMPKPSDKKSLHQIGQLVLVFPTLRHRFGIILVATPNFGRKVENLFQRWKNLKPGKSSELGVGACLLRSVRAPIWGILYPCRALAS